MQRFNNLKYTMLVHFGKIISYLKYLNLYKDYYYIRPWIFMQVHISGKISFYVPNVKTTLVSVSVFYSA